ncbi:MAG: zeta toxin family protein [Lactobacillaceae bacterium]|jgi:UDP-N-acetylglucosamine kinase|nr:zeta toxin family protein [Lactobacillaceae bacterium]
MGIEQFTEQEFQAKFARIIKRMTLGKRPSTHNAKAYILGGQSGAGKSSIHELLRFENGSNIIAIDGDTFRVDHPRARTISQVYGKADVKYTAAFAGRVVETLIDQLSDANYNLIIEGTLRTATTPLKTAALLKEKRYEVNLYAMAVRPELSYLSTLQRYEEMYFIKPTLARATPKEHHDLIITKYAQNLDVVLQAPDITAVVLVKRDMVPIYNSADTPDVLPSTII